MTKRITYLDIAKAAHTLDHIRLTNGEQTNIGYYKDDKIYRVVRVSPSGRVDTLNLFVNNRDLYDYLVRLTENYKRIHGIA